MPTDSPSPIVLTPPETLRPLAPREAEGLIRLKPETIADLDRRALKFLDTILAETPGSSAFSEGVDTVYSLGQEEIRTAAGLSNRLLEMPARSLQNGVLDAASPVSRSLIELRKTVEALDPSRQGDLLSPKKLLGIIPMGSKIKDYFLRYESAQSHLDAILRSLYDGQDELRKDNAAIEEEKVEAWAVMEGLEQYIYIGRRIDAALEAHVRDIEESHPEKTRIIREELLFSIRQKVQDLLTQLTVTVQGYLAMDIIRKNNLELIKGVDRATTTTISALRTAVIVAQALANQRLVLEQVSALNRKTGDLIEGTATMMKSQANVIHDQAASTTLDLNQLKRAFDQIYETLDLMATYRSEALTRMETNIDVLSEAIHQARHQIEHIQTHGAPHL